MKKKNNTEKEQQSHEIQTETEVKSNIPNMRYVLSLSLHFFLYFSFALPKQ